MEDAHSRAEVEPLRIMECSHVTDADCSALLKDGYPIDITIVVFGMSGHVRGTLAQFKPSGGV